MAEQLNGGAEANVVGREQDACVDHPEQENAAELQAQASPIGMLQKAAKEVFDISPAGKTMFHSSSPLRDVSFLANVPKGMRGQSLAEKRPCKPLMQVDSVEPQHIANATSGQIAPCEDTDASPCHVRPHEQAAVTDAETGNGDALHHNASDSRDATQCRSSDDAQSDCKCALQVHAHCAVNHGAQGCDGHTQDVTPTPTPSQANANTRVNTSASSSRSKGVKTGTKRGVYRKLSNRARDELETIFSKGVMKPGPDTIKAFALRFGCQHDQVWSWFRNRRTRRRRSKDNAKHSSGRRRSLQPPCRSVSITMAFSFANDGVVDSADSDAVQLQWIASAHGARRLRLILLAHKALSSLQLPSGAQVYTVVVNPHTSECMQTFQWCPGDGNMTVADAESLEELVRLLGSSEGLEASFVLEFYG